MWKATIFIEICEIKDNLSLMTIAISEGRRRLRWHQARKVDFNERIEVKDDDENNDDKVSRD